MILLALTVTVPKAQAQSSLVSSNTHALIPTLDTVTNTGTKSMTSARIPGYQHQVTVTTVNTNLTGTQSGIARLYGSLDGAKYVRIRSYQLHGLQVDSLIIGAGVNTLQYGWVVDNSPYQYYQVQTTGIGTVTFTVAGKYAAH